MDPIHQFQITNIFTFGRIGGAELAFTNSALFMLIALAVILALTVGATSARAMVPGRLPIAAINGPPANCAVAIPVSELVCPGPPVTKDSAGRR